MTTGESSKKAERRAKNTKNAILAAIRRTNRGITISDGRPSIEHAPHSNDSGSTPLATSNMDKGKKKRGPTRMRLINRVPRIPVEFNKRGQAIGSNSEKFASYIGVLAREHVAIVENDWGHIDSTTKDELWSLIQEKFIVDENHRARSLQMLGKCWRAYKSRLTQVVKEFAEIHGRNQATNFECPYGVTTKEQWHGFIKHRLSKDFEDKSKRFKSIRSNQKLLHTMSRRGYARLEDDMKNKSEGSNNDTSRVHVWTQGHLRKDGQPLNEAISDTLSKIKEWNEATSTSMSEVTIKDDALIKVLGPERRGRVRGLGFGVTPSSVDASNKSTRREKELEGRVVELEHKMNYMSKLEERIERLTSMFQQQQHETQSKGIEDVILSRNNTLQCAEAEGILFSQQKRIEELEAQLNEAEDVITDMRLELHEAQTELAKMKKIR